LRRTTASAVSRQSGREGGGNQDEKDVAEGLSPLEIIAEHTTDAEKFQKY
jgi:hypothetical protein